MRKLISIPVLLVFLGLSPFVLAIAANAIAYIFDCEMSGAGVQTCHALGHNIGGVLYGMALSPWLVFFTIPISLGLLLLYKFIKWVSRNER